MQNIEMVFSGGGTREDAAKSQLNEYTLDVLNGWWPEFSLVGTLPSSGLYLWHVDGLFLDNIRLTTIADDQRPPIILDDVLNDHSSRLFSNDVLIDVKGTDVVRK